MEDLLGKRQTRSVQTQSIGSGSMSRNLTQMVKDLIEAVQSEKAR